MNSAAWIEKADKYIMKTYGRCQLVPVRGEGCNLWDADGKKYLDFLAGFGSVNVGHHHPRLAACVRDFLERQPMNLVHVGPCGPAADLAGFRGAVPLDAGPVSLARILSGAPGYTAMGAEAARYEDGAWSLSDGRQTLRSDPGRRFLAGAEYRFPGMRVTVDYPGRASGDPPERIVLSVRGAKFTLRRDPE